METNQKIAYLLSDGVMQNTILVGACEAAVNIASESQGTWTNEEFAARRALCKKVNTNQVPVKTLMAAVLTDSTIKAALANVADPTMENLRAVVTDSLINTRLGGIWTNFALDLV